eukprot:scaffold76104_cov72-Attheya_sp.AAC.1
MGIAPSEHRNHGCGWKAGFKGFSKLVWMAQSDRYSKSYSRAQTYTDRHKNKKEIILHRQGNTDSDTAKEMEHMFHL